MDGEVTDLAKGQESERFKIESENKNINKGIGGKRHHRATDFRARK